MSQFLLLLHESTTDAPALSAAEIQAVIREYQAWGSKLAESGRLLAGHKLVDGSARHLSGHGADLSVTDGPLAEAKEIIGGFYQIEADDYDQAVKLVGDCPHLRFGGTIELRQIDLLDD